MSHYQNEEVNKPTSSDEIDLREVFASVGRFFASIGRGILNFILAIRRATHKFWILILAFLVSGAIIGFLYHQNMDSYFRARMVMDSRFYTFELLESIMENFNEQARVGANHTLAKELNLTEEQAAKIKGFEIQPLLPLEEKVNLQAYLRRIKESGNLFEEEQLDSLQERLLLNASQYVITAEIYDNGILDDLQKGLINHFSSKDYVARRAKVERQNLEMLKKSMEEDEKSLAKLKTEIIGVESENPIDFRTGSSTLILGANGEAGPTNIYQQSLAIYTQKAKINRNLLLSQEVELVSGFSPIETPASFSLLECILLGSLIGMGAAYSIILILAANRGLNRYEQRRKQM